MPAGIGTLTQQLDNELIRALGVPLDRWLADRLARASVRWKAPFQSSPNVDNF